MGDPGDPITAEEVAFGLTRSLDATEFPSGPGIEYSSDYFLDGDKNKGPYTDRAIDDAITFDADASTVTIKMATPFPDMDYWGSFMAMGPAPLGDVSSPSDYGKDPLTTGPYKIDSFRRRRRLLRPAAATTSGTRTPTRLVTSTPTASSSSSTPTRRRPTRSCSKRQHRVADLARNRYRLGQLHPVRLRAR